MAMDGARVLLAVERSSPTMLTSRASHGSPTCSTRGSAEQPRERPEPGGPEHTVRCHDARRHAHAANAAPTAQLAEQLVHRARVGARRERDAGALTGQDPDATLHEEPL